MKFDHWSMVIGFNYADIYLKCYMVRGTDDMPRKPYLSCISYRRLASPQSAIFKCLHSAKRAFTKPQYDH